MGDRGADLAESGDGICEPTLLAGVGTLGWRNARSGKLSVAHPVYSRRFRTYLLLKDRCEEELDRASVDLKSRAQRTGEARGSVRQGLYNINDGQVDCIWKSMRTVVNGAHMVTHGRNLNIVATVGAFDRGQAQIHSRHSVFVSTGNHSGIMESSRGLSGLPQLHHHELRGRMFQSGLRRDNDR